MKFLFSLLFFGIIFFESFYAHGQGGQYEIQVYGAELVKPGQTMVELHSNYTAKGFTYTDPFGVLADQGVFHETIEITHGWSEWLETGFYIFTTLGSDGRSGYVGSHIRPRLTFPERLGIPFGLSMSAEAGFQKSRYSSDIWTLELRPILDKTFFKKLYVSLNPVFGKSFKGSSQSQGFVYSTNVKVGYDFTKLINAGLEYYGTIGPLNEIYSPNTQFQEIFFVTDLNIGPKWEINAGVGLGLTPATEKWIFKTIIGRRFGK
jgi:hypothetical protein